MNATSVERELDANSHKVRFVLNFENGERMTSKNYETTQEAIRSINFILGHHDWEFARQTIVEF